MTGVGMVGVQAGPPNWARGGAASLRKPGLRRGLKVHRDWPSRCRWCPRQGPAGVQQSQKGRIWENWEEFQRAHFLGCL